jgi:hypothetical protein
MRLSLVLAILFYLPLAPAARAAGGSPDTAGIGDAPPAEAPAPVAPAAPPAPAAVAPVAVAPVVTPGSAPPRTVSVDDEASAPDPRKRFPRIQPPSLVHKDQFGVELMPGTGYRIIAPYKDGISCGQQANRVCTGRLPFFLDVQPSFGISRHWDVVVDLRFGLETDFNQAHEFEVAPGFRYWVDPDLSAKFFTTIQGVYDLSPQHDPGVKDYDFGVRNANGFMYEVMRNLGFYLQFGETLGLVRWLRFEVDGGVGVQARFP